MRAASFVLTLPLLALATNLTSEERIALANVIACPFIAAEVRHGRLTPEDGKWTKDQADAVMDTYMKPVFSKTWLVGSAIVGAFKLAVMWAFDFSDNDGTGPMPWVELKYMHGKHSGIRLTNITADSSTWKQPCHQADLGAWSMDPSCGEPGVHPEVFDHYATLLGKQADDTWNQDDLEAVCDKADDTIYVEGKAQPYGPSSKSLCVSTYKAMHWVFGDITTADLKAFLINSTYPASYDLKPRVAGADASFRPEVSVAVLLTATLVYFLL